MHTPSEAGGTPPQQSFCNGGKINLTQIADPTPPTFITDRQPGLMSTPPTLGGHAGREGIQIDADTILLLLLPAKLPASVRRQADALIHAWRTRKQEREEEDEDEGLSTILYVHGGGILTEDGEEWPVYPPAIPISSLSPFVDEHISAFHITNLDFRLRRLFASLHAKYAVSPLKHLAVAGAGAGATVESTVRNAADMGYIVTCVTDAVSGESPEREARAAYVSQKEKGREEGRERRVAGVSHED